MACCRLSVCLVLWACVKGCIGCATAEVEQAVCCGAAPNKPSASSPPPTRPPDVVRKIIYGDVDLGIVGLDMLAEIGNDDPGAQSLRRAPPCLLRAQSTTNALGKSVANGWASSLGATPTAAASILPRQSVLNSLAGHLFRLPPPRPAHATNRRALAPPPLPPAQTSSSCMTRWTLGSATWRWACPWAAALPASTRWRSCAPCPGASRRRCGAVGYLLWGGLAAGAQTAWAACRPAGGEGRCIAAASGVLLRHGCALCCRVVTGYQNIARKFFADKGFEHVVLLSADGEPLPGPCGAARAACGTIPTAAGSSTPGAGLVGWPIEAWPTPPSAPHRTRPGLSPPLELFKPSTALPRPNLASGLQARWRPLPPWALPTSSWTWCPRA